MKTTTRSKYIGTILTTVLVLFSLGLSAQVSVNTDGSAMLGMNNETIKNK